MIEGLNASEDNINMFDTDFEILAMYGNVNPLIYLN